MSETDANNTAGGDHRCIDALLTELRAAGQVPERELLDAISALGMEAVPALIALVTDPAAYLVSEDERDVSYWAPYPAVEILGELHPPEALEPLLTLLTWDDYDYLTGIVPEALARFGRVALDPLTAVLTDEGHTVWTRWRAASTMERTAVIFPELRDEVVARLTAQLDCDEPDNENLDTLRGALVDDLIELQASEALPSIIRTFEETRIDPFLISWSDVQERLDLPPEVAPHLAEFAPRRRPYFDFPFNPPPLGADVRPSSSVSAPTGRMASETDRRSIPKVGRNQPCPCGSGKKYKRCHGRRQRVLPGSGRGSGTGCAH